MKKSLLYLLSVVVLVGAFLIIPINNSFAQSTYKLTVTKPSDWPKGGYVTSSPAGINCKSDCSENYSSGTSVTLTAHTNSGYRFVYWTGDCSGSSTTCNLSMTENKTVSALWEYKNINIKVSMTGDGSGKVTGSSLGINCSSSCTKSVTTNPYPPSSSGSLKAAPSSGSTFAGWQTSGDICYSGGGKAGDAKVNTDKTCSFSYSGTWKKTITAVAKFNSKGGSSGGSSSGSSSGSNSSDASSSPSSSSSTTEENGSPKTPTVEKIEVSGNEVSTEDPLEVNSDEPLVLSGKTVPNGIITLTIHSDPVTVKTKADKDGNWSYTITDLPEGDHYVEASVKDPKTNKTSKLGKLLSFTVKPAAATSGSGALSPEENLGGKGGSALATAGIVFGAIVAALALTALYLWKFKNTTFNNILRRLHIKKNDSNIPPQPPTGPSYG